MQFAAHLGQFVIEIGIVAGDDSEAVDGVEAVEERQGLFDGTHAQAAAHDEDVLIRLMGGIPMPAFLFKGLAHGDPGDDDLAGIDALFDEQVLELGRGDAVDIDLRIDPELMDGKIGDDADQGDIEAVLALEERCRPCREGMGKGEDIGLLFGQYPEHPPLEAPGKERLDDESLLISL